MGNREHQRLIVHKIQYIFIHEDLQTGRKLVIRFPEAQNHGKKREQPQFISRISFFQLFSLKLFTGADQRVRLSVKTGSGILKEVAPLFQRAAPDAGETFYIYPFMSQTAYVALNRSCRCYSVALVRDGEVAEEVLLDAQTTSRSAVLSEIRAFRGRTGQMALEICYPLMEEDRTIVGLGAPVAFAGIAVGDYTQKAKEFA